MRVDAEPPGDDALEVERVEPTPAYDPVLLTIRPGRDDLRKLGPLLLRPARLGTRRPIVDEATGPGGVEAMDPVTQRMAVHPADLPPSPGPYRPGPQPATEQPALVDSFRPPGQRPKRRCRIILSQSHR